MANEIQAAGAGLATYLGYGTGYAAYATPTDLLTISGSATKVIRVINMIIRVHTTAGALQKFFFIKRTAANSGGTASTPAAIKLDTGNPPASAVLQLYSVIPAGLGAGTTLGEASVVTTVPTSVPAAFSLGTPITNVAQVTNIASGVVLRGASEFLALNFNGAALPAGFTSTWEVMWTESDD